ncbi:MAG: sugar transferase [Bacteroidota bacterium]|nr:sugar transferase [Bacteroidota bacterium]
MNKNLQVLKYVIADYFSAALAWGLFFIYRKYNIDPQIISNLNEIFEDPNFWYGIGLIPFFWLFLYVGIGTYRKIYRKSRLKELGQTLMISFSGVLIIFFALILDDIIISYKAYYQSFLVLFGFHFVLTYSLRLILTSITVYRIHKKIIGFNTIVVGSNGNAILIYNDIESQEESSGNKFIGFVSAYEYNEYKLSRYLPHLGHTSELAKIINEQNVEEVIVAIERSEHKTFEQIIAQLEESNVVIKIIPQMQDYLMGTVKMSSIFHAPLIEISPDLMPAWQQFIKRGIDIVASIIAIILLSPIFLFTALGVKFSSKGPIIYSQEKGRYPRQAIPNAQIQKHVQ